MKNINFNAQAATIIEKIKKDIEDIYPLPLWKLLFLSFYASGKKYFQSEKIKKIFPHSLYDYSFVYQIKPSPFQPDIKVLLYRNSKGQKIIVKIWQGLHKDYY